MPAADDVKLLDGSSRQVMMTVSTAAKSSMVIIIRHSGVISHTSTQLTQSVPLGGPIALIMVCASTTLGNLTVGAGPL